MRKPEVNLYLRHDPTVEFRTQTPQRRTTTIISIITTTTTTTTTAAIVIQLNYY